MKIYIKPLTMMIYLILLSGCGETSQGKFEKQGSVESVIAQQVQSATADMITSDTSKLDATTSDTSEIETEESVPTEVIKYIELPIVKDSVNMPKEVAEVIQEPKQSVQDFDEDSNEDSGEDSSNLIDSTIDLDLTTMGSDMVYATVYHIMVTPDEFIGKKVKIKGTFSANYYEGTGRYYYSVLITDAMACCAQGIEFVWGDGNHIYPDDYPEKSAQIEVVGTFETYREEDVLYCQLVNSTMRIAE